MGYRQVIIARKDILGDKPGKLAAQVAHGSMAYFTNLMRQFGKKCWNDDIGRVYAWRIAQKQIPMLYMRNDLTELATKARNEGKECLYYKRVERDHFEDIEEYEPTFEDSHYEVTFDLDPHLFEEWILGPFTKTVCEAKNKAQLLKVEQYAENLNLKRDKDYFLIFDHCLYGLEPEEEDGTTLTCIGFKPLPDEIAHQISKKYQLFR